MFENMIAQNTSNDSQQGQLSTFLKTYFGRLNTFLMPHPGKKALKKAFDGSWRYLDEEFVEQLRDLCGFLFDRSTMKPKVINDEPITAGQFVIWLRQYAHIFESTSPPCASTINESFCRASMEVCYEKCVLEYRERMHIQWTSPDSLTDLDNLDNSHRTTLNSVLDQMDSAENYGQLSIVKEYKDKLKEKLNGDYSYQRQNLAQTLDLTKKTEDKMLFNQFMDEFSRYAEQSVAESVTMTTEEFEATLQKELCARATLLRDRLQRKHKADQIVKEFHDTIQPIISRVTDGFKKYKRNKNGERILYDSIQQFESEIRKLMATSASFSDLNEMTERHSEICDKLLDSLHSRVDGDDILCDNLRTQLRTELEKRSEIYLETLSQKWEAAVIRLNEICLTEAVNDYTEEMQNNSNLSLKELDEKHQRLLQKYKAEVHEKAKGTEDDKKLLEQKLHSHLQSYYQQARKYLEQKIQTEESHRDQIAELKKLHQKEMEKMQQASREQRESLNRRVNQTTKKRRRRCSIL